MLRDGPARTIENALDGPRGAPAQDLADDPDFTELELSDDEWDQFHAEAEVLVRKYFELEDPTTILPIGLELRLAATIGKVQLRGIIDRLELDADGELVVTDYKTGSVPSERYEIKRLAGVHMYAAMVAARAREAPGPGPTAVPVQARSDHHRTHRAVGDRGDAQDRCALVGDRPGLHQRRLPPPFRACSATGVRTRRTARSSVVIRSRRWSCGAPGT